MLPIGLIGMVLMTELFDLTVPKLSVNSLPKIFGERLSLIVTTVLCIILIGYFSTHAYRSEWKALDGLNTYKNTLTRLSALGDYLEANVERPSRFIAPAQASVVIPDLFSQSMMDYLPGLSSKSKVVFFRYILPPYPVDMDKINLVFSLDSSIIFKQRINILKRYHIQYVLIDNHFLSDYYANQPQFFDVQEVDGYWLLKLRDISLNQIGN